MLARRARVSAEDRDAAARAILEGLLRLPEVADARRVLAFVSIRSEVPTAALVEALLARGTAVFLPYVAEDGSPRAAEVASLDDLSPGYRGIPEPRARTPVDPSSADAIVVPGVAFDASGGRLGYGGGFYDRFLREAGLVPRIGVCFELQVVDEVPMLEHDERVDVVVTEQRVIRPAAVSGPDGATASDSDRSGGRIARRDRPIH